MLHLYLQAPFAACRTFAAGWYRPTATFITPSAMYGLLMNVAGVETRHREEEHQTKYSASLMKMGLPSGKIALGIPASDSGNLTPPSVQSIYQQLHNYPVGASAGMPPELSKGNKNNITPVRREFLTNVKAVVACEFEAELESILQDQLAGKHTEDRYGIPFLGDNSFLLDRLEVLDDRTTPAVHWYCRLEETQSDEPPKFATRLTTWINRADMSLTKSALYAPAAKATTEIPETAWSLINPP